MGGSHTPLKANAAVAGPNPRQITTREQETEQSNNTDIYPPPTPLYLECDIRDDSRNNNNNNNNIRATLHPKVVKNSVCRKSTADGARENSSIRPRLLPRNLYFSRNGTEPAHVSLAPASHPASPQPLPHASRSAMHTNTNTHKRASEHAQDARRKTQDPLASLL